MWQLMSVTQTFSSFPLKLAPVPEIGGLESLVHPAWLFSKPVLGDLSCIMQLLPDGCFHSHKRGDSSSW